MDHYLLHSRKESEMPFGLTHTLLQ